MLNAVNSCRRSTRTAARPAAVPSRQMSQYSTAAIPDSVFADQNFLLGAGMVVIQESTHRIVMCYERERKYWFLPKGRKDIGQTLEETALREAYEESGYRVEPRLLYTNTLAPGPPNDPQAYREPNWEPIMMTTIASPARKSRRTGELRPASVYLISWYVGAIAADAVREEGTMMPDEVNYETHLLSLEEARRKLWGTQEMRVVEYAWTLYTETIAEIERKSRVAQGSMPEPAPDSDDSESSPSTSSE
ncbi:Nudix hydrolase domain-containing protein [Mycena chlorophos]|uniref:Nudix hydrolase domain-containing protein n=1 Tax=Mycena chlorophos TaxID=658473 RepID=A0A8H6VNT4_MYCCL|nr:Nudix hydrolase domain-containing protein [Mycena chlorophos]